jgi:hypothetical protein
MAMLTAGQKAQIAAQAPVHRPNPGTCYCGQPGVFTPGGWRCPAHRAQSAGARRMEVSRAIGSYVREHGTTPWPWRVKGVPSALTYSDEPGEEQP